MLKHVNKFWLGLVKKQKQNKSMQKKKWAISMILLLTVPELGRVLIMLNTVGTFKSKMWITIPTSCDSDTMKKIMFSLIGSLLALCWQRWLVFFGTNFGILWKNNNKQPIPPNRSLYPLVWSNFLKSGTIKYISDSKTPLWDQRIHYQLEIP